MEDFGLEWACRMDFYRCKAVNKLMLMLSSFSAVYMVHFPYILCVYMYVQEFSVYYHNPLSCPVEIRLLKHAHLALSHHLRNISV